MPTEPTAPIETFHWLPGATAVAAVLLGGLLLRTIAFRSLARWARNTATRVDDVVLATLRWPSVIWIIQAAIVVGLHLVHLPGENVDAVARRTMLALLVLSVTLALGRLVRELMSGHLRGEAGVTAGERVAPPGLLTTFVTIVTLLVGMLVMLGVLGINIMPLVGALGVGGLAAGLALQPTLSNLFAGFQVAMSRQLRIGHRVRLASGEDGYIEDIAWRTTTLRTPANHLVIIPNAKLADTIVTNFNLPDAAVNITVPVNVAYASDPRRVEAALLDEAKKLVAELPEMVHTAEPSVRLQAFGESGLLYHVTLRVRDFEAQFATWNEVYMRLFERLRRENVQIPFPSRDFYLRGPWPPQEAAALAKGGTVAPAAAAAGAVQPDGGSAGGATPPAGR